jgi:hypothetical protein
VAQTKRKRKSKHRGTAAGTVSARGRTSRPLSEKARKDQRKEVAREARLGKPPSWQRSMKTAAFAGVVMFLFLYLIVEKKTGKNAPSNPLLSALGLAVVAMLFYVPAGYYMERFLWRRRMERKGGGR